MSVDRCATCHGLMGQNRIWYEGHMYHPWCDPFRADQIATLTATNAELRAEVERLTRERDHHSDLREQYLAEAEAAERAAVKVDRDALIRVLADLQYEGLCRDRDIDRIADRIIDALSPAESEPEQGAVAEARAAADKEFAHLAAAERKRRTERGLVCPPSERAVTEATDWVLVPTKLTFGMRVALEEAILRHDKNLDRVWQEVLDFAPSQERLTAAGYRLVAPGEVDTWRPIETAPKDRGAFLAWGEGYEWPEVLRWFPYDEDDAAEIGEEGYFHFAEEFLQSAWDAPDVAESFTHWMPLPPAPSIRAMPNSQDGHNDRDREGGE